jgi:hypothetical protein
MKKYSEALYYRYYVRFLLVEKRNEKAKPTQCSLLSPIKILNLAPIVRG